MNTMIATLVLTLVLISASQALAKPPIIIPPGKLFIKQILAVSLVILQHGYAKQALM
jgi:hypothetical protein